MNAKLRLLYVGNALSKHGYTPTSIETLSEQLREDYEVTIVSNQKNQLLRLFDMLLGVVRHRKQVDCILIDTYSTKSFYYTLMVSQLARLFKMPYFTYLHGGDLPKRLDRTPFIASLIFNNSVDNIAPSQYMREAFKKHNYSVQFIPNNIDLSLYTNKKRAKLQPRFLYVRSFSSVYNPQMAIKAFSKLKEKFPEATMCMVGPDKDGTLEKCREFASILGLKDSIEFPGKMQKQEWLALSSGYDIFINPTNFDNQPVSIIEAMALGFPIISTNVGGLPFLIEDGVDGILVDKNDDNAMYEKMMTLLQDEKTAQMLSENARKKAESFDWKNVQKLWKNILDGVEKKNVL